MNTFRQDMEGVVGYLAALAVCAVMIVATMGLSAWIWSW